MSETTTTTYEIEAEHLMYGENQWVRISNPFESMAEACRIEEGIGSYRTRIVKVVTTRTPVGRPNSPIQS